MGTNILNKSLHKSYIWLHEIDDSLGINNLDAALAALRAVLHELRDHIPTEVAASFSAQLPTLIRGIFFEGWNPSHTHQYDRSAEAFTHTVQDNLDVHPEINAIEAIKAVSDTLKNQISIEEFNKIIILLPKAVRSLLNNERNYNI